MWIRQVYVGKQKRAVLEALGDVISTEDRARITTDDTATNLHVVPMAGSRPWHRGAEATRFPVPAS